MKRLVTLAIPLIAGCLFGESPDTPIQTVDNNVANNSTNNIDCSCPDAVPENAAGWVCVDGSCVLDCEDGFRLDETAACTNTGCESEDPLGDYIDQNCDGADGIVDENVYVSSNAPANGDGLSPDSPVSSLAAGVSLAESNGRFSILVTSGLFFGNLVIDEDRLLIGFYAEGFDLASVDPTVAAPIDPTIPTVIVTSSSRVSFRNFAITGGDLSGDEDGDPSATIALYAEADSEIAFTNVALIGGNGQPGPDGVDGPPAGSGAAGTDGVNATGGTGGLGGAMNGGGSGNSAGLCNLLSIAQSGRPQQIGGMGGADGCVTTAQSASNGGNGGPGPAGMNSSVWEPELFGDFSNGAWVFDDATPVNFATPGGIGGGGGGGGALQAIEPNNRFGGGGGGGGGAGGLPGEFGKIGSPSVVLLVDEDVSVTGENVEIRIGIGGKGGDGGSGSCGGLGGSGGSGQAGPGGLTSGSGGSGGEGGAGGNGAGGPGGPSIGVWSASALDESIFRFVAPGMAAEGGAGGEACSSGNSAGDAPPGARGVVLEVVAPP